MLILAALCSVSSPAEKPLPLQSFCYTNLICPNHPQTTISHSSFHYVEPIGFPAQVSFLEWGQARVLLVLLSDRVEGAVARVLAFAGAARG